jgi:hypothetical protein
VYGYFIVLGQGIQQLCQQRESDSDLSGDIRLGAIHADADLMQYGLSTVLNMHGNQFSWSASVFYFAFLVWLPAVAYIHQHFPLGKVISVS